MFVNADFCFILDLFLNNLIQNHLIMYSYLKILNDLKYRYYYINNLIIVVFIIIIIIDFDKL